MVYIITAVFVTYVIVTGFIFRNTILREERLEDEYNSAVNLVEERLIETKIKIESVVERLNEIDIRGAFESDDEIGFVFKEIKQLNEELLEFIQLYSTQQNNKNGEESESGK
jgi:adenylate kinase family enzyme